MSILRATMQGIHNYTEPNWAPLERAICATGWHISVCGEFMWMCEQPEGTHQFKHRLTRKYAHLSETMSIADAVDSVMKARTNPLVQWGRIDTTERD